MSRIKFKCCLLAIIFMCLVGLTSQVHANPDQIEQIILVLWHGLEIEQIPKFKLSSFTTWGLLNTRGGGGDSLTSSYLSIGAGARAVGWAKATALTQDPDDAILYELHTGIPPTLIVQPQIAQILQAQKVNYQIVIGALGNAFREANLPIKVLGNSDSDEQVRLAALASMDEFGRVFSGDLGLENLLKDPVFPFGVKTNYAKLLHELELAAEPLVVVDLGDPFRFDRYQNNYFSPRRDLIQEMVFAEGEAFVEKLAGLNKSQTAIIVISPHPSSRRAEQGVHLTPIFATGLPSGLFCSATTRWPGLITNQDIAPTLLKLLDLKHNQPFIGRPAIVKTAQNSKAVVHELGTKIVAVSSKRSTVLQVVIVGQIVLYLSVLVVLIIPRKFNPLFLRLWQTLLLLFLLLPLTLLFLAKLGWLFLGILALFSILLMRRFTPLLQVGLVSLVTSVALALDVLWGGPLIRFSYLGYDAIGGARFYGIGNEFMGIFVGSTVLAWAIFCQQFSLGLKLRTFFSFLVFTLALVIIGAPSLGTNVGGAITGVFAFGVVWLSFREKKINWKSWAGLILGLVVVLFILILVDQQNSSDRQSHIGQTAQLFKRDGFKALWLIIVRKLGMNLKLLRYSMWSKALLVALVVLVVSFIWPSKFIYGLKNTYPLVVKGIGGVVVGSVAAFVFNDSGVVAAATCLYFAVTTLLILALELKHNFNTPQTNVENDGNRH